MARPPVVDTRRFAAPPAGSHERVHITPIGGPAPVVLSVPTRVLPTEGLERAADQIAESTDPQRFQRLRRWLRPPAVLATASPAAWLKRVRNGSALDTPNTVQCAAGAVDAADVLRILYVEPTVDGAPASTAAHELRSIALSTRASTLGRPSGEAQTLVSRTRNGQRVQFAGFAATQVNDGLLGARPVMLATARALGGTRETEYIVVDHDPSTGAPRALVVDRAPAPGRFHFVTPGLAWGMSASGPWLLAAFITEASGEPFIVVGRLLLGTHTARFVETDRTAIPGAEAGSTSPWFDLPVVFQPEIQQWIVESTVGGIAWEGRFQVVDRTGRFYRSSGGGVPAPTLWWPPAPEPSHSGNGAWVHPRTGSVAFKAAHNTVSGRVSATQGWVNQWEGSHHHRLDSLHPPETFPAASHWDETGNRAARWGVSPCLRDPWEFISTFGTGQCLAVAQGSGEVRFVGKLFDSVAPPSSEVFTGAPNNGCHTIVRVDALAVTAHVATWRDASGRIALGAAFVEDAFHG